MTRAAKGWQRKLLFRSYLILVASLLAVAALLDAGFTYLQSRLAPAEDRWLESSFRLIEAELASAPPEARYAVAARISDTLGIGVQVLQPDEIVEMASPPGGIARLTEESGEISYLRRSPSTGVSIRLGPMEPVGESVLLHLLPPLFYLSIFVVVGLWLRPILRDLDRITRATQMFADDYREPIATSAETTQLTSLAQNLDEMSARLSGLIQSQKELTAALSHEMRTPLARIRFALAVMDRGDTEEQKRQLEAIESDLREVDGLIKSILEYARLDHPDQRMNRQLTPVAPWVGQILESRRMPEPQIEFLNDGDCDSAWMDPRLMAIALSNLVVNACRHARSTVRLAVRRLRSGYQLIVEDDGDGIPEEQRENVFRAFARLDESRSRDTGGFGLGLAIVARIAALHGGGVTVDASPELGGARFTVQWPEGR